jgi:hypothetical protein
MRRTRRRSDRSDSVRRRHVSHPEALEDRQVLSSTSLPVYLSPWTPSDLPVTNPITHRRELVSARSLVSPVNVNSPGLTNEGKIVSGTDRAGNLWVITVHGPGKVIVTDTTPNDGVLDDDINTIQLVGTNPRTTFVTGNVQASPKVLTQGTVVFNQLLATKGVNSIALNGFVLSSAVSPAVTTTTGVFLYGGVKTLSFQDIDASIDSANGVTPYSIVIGTAGTPLTVQPSIYLHQITNLVASSTGTTIPTTPVTTPSVQFIINGVLENFDIVSTSQGPVGAGFQFELPVVATTGRTSIQATAVNRLNVRGSAKNFTVSRAAQPFQTDSSGLQYLKQATFGGNADAVGIDVDGPIGRLEFRRGLGDPSGVFTARGSSGQLLPATSYGTATGGTGYPAAGYLGGTISARHIRKLVVRPANELTQTAQNPLFVQQTINGYPTYTTNPGYSLTNAVVTSSGSIDQVSLVGTPLNSEVKTGFDYPAFLAGLEGTRAPSRIGRVQVNGDLINTDISATVRPANHHYRRGTGVLGPGTITGKVTGNAFDTGGITGLGNTGSGVFARHLHGRLPAAI